MFSESAHRRAHRIKSDRDSVLSFMILIEAGHFGDENFLTCGQGHGDNIFRVQSGKNIPETIEFSVDRFRRIVGIKRGEHFYRLRGAGEAG